MAYCSCDFYFFETGKWKGRPFSIEGSGSATGESYANYEDGYYVNTDIVDIEPQIEDYTCYWDDTDLEFTEDEYSEFGKDKDMNNWLDSIMTSVASESDDWDFE